MWGYGGTIVSAIRLPHSGSMTYCFCSTLSCACIIGHVASAASCFTTARQYGEYEWPLHMQMAHLHSEELWSNAAFAAVQTIAANAVNHHHRHGECRASKVNFKVKCVHPFYRTTRTLSSVNVRREAGNLANRVQTASPLANQTLSSSPPHGSTRRSGWSGAGMAERPAQTRCWCAREKRQQTSQRRQRRRRRQRRQPSSQR